MTGGKEARQKDGGQAQKTQKTHATLELL